MLSILPLPTSPVPFQTVTALGFFDGVHRGHRALLEKAVQIARELGARPAVFTFASPFKGKLPLTDAQERLRLFEEAGIEVVFLADFSDVRTLSPKEFVNNCLQKNCCALSAVCGFNFRFGKGAVATAEDLVALLPSAVVLPAVYEGGEVISSSYIRTLIQEGQVEKAALLLGRPYSLSGEVLHGKALGASLGFPTANMRPDSLLPASGVYETQIEIEGRLFRALTDVGTRPTVEGEGEARVETHIPDFNENLYGRCLRVSFIRRLRPERKFASVEELKAQLKRDLKALQSTEKGTQNA